MTSLYMYAFSRHKALSYACSIFSINVIATCANPALHKSWLAVLITSIYHHQVPTNRVLIVADQIAVFNLVYQHGAVICLCPAWLVAFFVTTVMYTAIWYYPAKLGRVPEHLHLPLHLVTYAATSTCGLLIAKEVVIT